MSSIEREQIVEPLLGGTMDVIVFQLVDLVEKIRLSRKGAAAAAAAEAAGTSAAPPVAATATTSSKNTTGSAATDSDTRRLQEVIRNSPAVKFLTRTDFFSMVQYSDVSVSQ